MVWYILTYINYIVTWNPRTPYVILLHGIHGIQPQGHLRARLAQRSEVRGHVDVGGASLLPNFGWRYPQQKPASFHRKKSEK